jgi:hypothetical protein
MFSLTVVFGASGNPWVLLYKTKESLEAAMANYRADKTTTFESSDFTAMDDFGSAISIKRSSIHGIMAEDMDLSKMNAIERGLHHARAQAQAEQRAAADPVLKAASMHRGGNAMLSPGFNGAFRQ